MSKDQVFTDILLSGPAIQNNLAVLTYNRSFTALIVGCVLGISGYSGWSGFIFFFLAQAVMGILLQHKLDSKHSKIFFPSRWHLWTHEVLSSTTLLTFVTSWTLTFSCIHVF